MEDQLTPVDLEALDPTPDVHSLFAYYNKLYFDGKLGACSVEWSTKRMTMCAGVCCYSRTSGCRIKLSEPLLKFRPIKDLKETLLHEMIHAELFLDGVKNDGDHGLIFRSRMTAINTATFTDYQRPVDGYNITVYHTMHEEVNLYRTHVWSCDRCGNTVKRSMNRPPQEADCRSFTKIAAAAAAAQGQPGSYCRDSRCWYHLHVKHCGGSYIKISEPEKPAAANKAAATSSSGTQQQSSSNKRPKQPAAAAAVGMHPIEAFFKKKDSQQQQESVPSEDSKQPERPQGQDPSIPQGSHQQQHQQQQCVQQQGEQQQQQPLQSFGNYWSSLGRGRTLAASAGQPPVLNPGGPGHSTSVAAAAATSGQRLVPKGLLGEGNSARSQSGKCENGGPSQQQQQQQRQPLRDLGLVQSQQLQQKQQQNHQQERLASQQGHWKQLAGQALLEPQEKQQQPERRGVQQQQRQRHRVAAAARSLQEAVDVVELLSSDDDDEAEDHEKAADTTVSPTSAGAGAAGMQRSVAAHSISGHGGASSSKSFLGGVDATGIGSGDGAAAAAAAAALMCPVCCQEWYPGEISNVQLNAHLDECLARMH